MRFLHWTRMIFVLYKSKEFTLSLFEEFTLFPCRIIIIYMLCCMCKCVKACVIYILWWTLNMLHTKPGASQNKAFQIPNQTNPTQRLDDDVWTKNILYFYPEQVSFSRVLGPRARPIISRRLCIKWRVIKYTARVRKSPDRHSHQSCMVIFESSSISHLDMNVEA